jgi:serine/threonine protein kinase
MTQPSDPFVGCVLGGRYRLDRIVADGGMGRVYEGVRLEDSERVAVKILHQDVAQEAVNIERFRREADTSHALEHPHVVEVHDFALERPAPGQPEGAWFLVMEFLDGEELRAELTRTTTVPPVRVLRMISQCALALDCAHGKGFVHRDLKPENVFIVRDDRGGSVKILDFGSVKFTRGQDRGNKITVVGTTIGSPFYMSPEQARGAQDLDERADVWALGAIVYEMVVGTVPFSATTGPQILFKILSESPEPPSFANDACPHEFDNVVLKALAKDAGQRFASCGAFADALGHAFGLTGDHRRWAETSEQELARQFGERRIAEPQVIPMAQPITVSEQVTTAPIVAAPTHIDVGAATRRRVISIAIAAVLAALIIVVSIAAMR